MASRIENSVHIEAEPGVVYDALISPDLVRRWLCHEATVEPRVGGRYEMKWSAVDRGAPIRYEGSGEIVELNPGKHLAFRLAPGDGPGQESVIEFRIEGTNGACDLTLIQSGFGDDTDGRRQRDAYARGWASCLAVLRSLLEDEPQARLIPAPMHRDVPLPGQEPYGVAWDDGRLWLSDAGRGRIFRLDPVSGRVLGSFAFEGEPSGLACDGECLWQADREDRMVVKLDRDGRVLKRLPAEHVRGELTGVAWDGQHLWLGDGGETDGRVLKIHPRSGIVYHKLSVTPSVSGLAWDGGKLWLADYEARVVQRIEPQTGQVLERIAVKGHPTGLTWDGERLWYADAEWKLLSRIL